MGGGGGVQRGVQALGSACQACHDAFREEGPSPGAYRVKGAVTNAPHDRPAWSMSGWGHGRLAHSSRITTNTVPMGSQKRANRR